MVLEDYEHDPPKGRRMLIRKVRTRALCKACGAEKDDGLCRFCPGPPAEVIELRDL